MRLLPCKSPLGSPALKKMRGLATVASLHKIKDKGGEMGKSNRKREPSAMALSWVSQASLIR
jgi:hypothetical protein